MRRLAGLLALLLLTPLLAGCFGGPPTVALLLADEDSTGHLVDVEVFTDRIKDACADCVVKVYDAAGDAAEQKSQVRQALAADAEALVVWPVSPEEAEEFSLEDTSMVSLVTVVPGSDRFVGLADEVDPRVARQGSSLEAARDVILGKRESMVHVPVLQISEQAADATAALMAEQPMPDSVLHEGVRSWLYEPTEVTIDNLTTVLIGEGVLTIDELCDGETAQRCRELGFV